MDSQSLRSTIKSVRDQMRKDENLSTDVERIPQLSWVIFLKCFDDFEKKQEAINSKYRPIIPIKYRWRDWVSEFDKNQTKKVLTGDDLIKFINTDLFPVLGNLVGEDQKMKNIIASIFRELNNRFVSGFILRKVLNLVDKISIISTDDIHTMAHMYEQMLIEMRDAAGTSGEFYTPRPVIRFIVNQIKPDLSKSEKILDPACGTGGFLVESLDYMSKQVGPIRDHKKLTTNTFFGIEKKPMPYLLGIMNLLLHEISQPNIVRTNTLGKPLGEISTDNQYDIIMTNPPFGGEEEEGIALNLPMGMQTSSTALAFLLYIMASLKNKGRCAIILPDGPLFGDKIAVKFKKKLLEEFNLHTIIRLPSSVFAPYTGITTNILFFDKTDPTEYIWYYAMKVSNRVQGKAKDPKYSKTKPIEYEDFADVEKWFKKKIENTNAWKVDVRDIHNFNLDLKNPNDVDETQILTPHELIESFIHTREQIIKSLKDIKKIISKEIPNNV